MLLGKEFLYLRECKGRGIVGHHTSVNVVITLGKEDRSS